MNQSIDEAKARRRSLDAAIRKTEILVDGAIRILEEVRRERKNLDERIERMQIEDAVEFPSWING